MKDFIRLILGRTLALFLRIGADTYRPEPGRVLVMAPHADDETLGCGGLIALRCRAGLPVTVAFVTNSAGTSSDPGMRAALARTREEEARRALAVLGLGPADIHFLDAPDGQLPSLGPAERARLTANLDALIRELGPSAVYLPFSGSHSTEHEAAHFLVRDALNRTAWHGQLWEYPVWAWWNPLRFAARALPKPRPVCLPLGSLVRDKQKALAEHTSQFEPRSGLPSILARLCLGRWEFFFPLTPIQEP